MRVRFDFDHAYATQEDPWSIGAADDERYDLYRERLLARAALRGSILDIGSGYGAFLARFADDFDESYAVEVAAHAVSEGATRYPWITFWQGSAEALDASHAAGRRYSAVVYSDVIAYLTAEGKRGSLAWIADHLEGGGVALVAAYSPGGDYPTADELRSLAEERFVVLEEQRLDSQHLMLVLRPRERLVALTIDYETWQPIPAGRRIDWDADVFGPTDALLDAASETGAVLTLFAEAGEYLWLREHDPDVAERMAGQWQRAITAGHDVQLHLHPNWLPETGARKEGDAWYWDPAKRTISDFAGNLDEPIARCRRALEDAIRPVDASYCVTCFRAGAYEAQPFRRLHDALVANGITCDSSVYQGGYREGRTYDYRLAFSDSQPYFASAQDPQLKAPPSEREVVEMPIFAPSPNERWTFDFAESSRFADVLLDAIAPRPGETAEARRRRERLIAAGGLAYWAFRRWRKAVNRLLPRSLAYSLVPYPPERLVDDDYFVLVGHSKADLDIAAITDGLRSLAPHVHFATLSELAKRARQDLNDSVSPSRAAEAERQVRREAPCVLGSERNEAQSAELQRRIPLDRHRILDLGCGAGDWSARIASTRPWTTVLGVDVGEEFVTHARRHNASERVSFEVADFAALPIDDLAYDCVYADNSLEHAFDIDETLAETHRVLGDGGLLVAGIPSDARNPRRICDNHTWKTAPRDVRQRLEAAGFSDIAITEIDTYRRLGMSPYPPSEDRMMFIRAWKRSRSISPLERAMQLSRFVYERLDPEHPSTSEGLEEILAEGTAWCTGYAMAAGLLLEGEGAQVRWVTLVADRPPPQGDAKVDAHEVLEVKIQGTIRTLDPMADVWFEASVLDLLRSPELADTTHREDARYRQRGYAHYTRSSWYRGVRRIAVQANPRDPVELRPVADVLAADRLPISPLWRRHIVRARERLRALRARMR